MFVYIISSVTGTNTANLQLSFFGKYKLFIYFCAAVVDIYLWTEIQNEYVKFSYHI